MYFFKFLFCFDYFIADVVQCKQFNKIVFCIRSCSKLGRRLEQDCHEAAAWNGRQSRSSQVIYHTNLYENQGWEFALRFLCANRLFSGKKIITLSLFKRANGSFCSFVKERFSLVHFFKRAICFQSQKFLKSEPRLCSKK